VTHPAPLRILVVGDSYMPAGLFTAALAALGDAVTVTELQLDTADPGPARTESDRSLREYAGDPADLVAAVPGHDALLVHGAPVSAEVLDAAPLRLVCCARGGPVNVDVAAASRRGIPVTRAPGRNAEAVAELTIALALMLIRGVPAAARYLTAGGQLAESTYEGSQFLGCEAAGLTLGLVGLGNVGREVAARAGPWASPCSATTRSGSRSSRPGWRWSAGTSCSAGRGSSRCTPGPPRITGT